MVCVWGATQEEIEAFDRLSPCRWLAKVGGGPLLQQPATLACYDDHAFPALVG